MDKIEINEKTRNFLKELDRTIAELQGRAQTVLQTYADAIDIDLLEYNIAADFTSFIRKTPLKEKDAESNS